MGNFEPGGGACNERHYWGSFVDVGGPFVEETLR